MSERTLPPQGEAKIDVTVSTAGRRGRLSKTVRVYSNDPKTPVARLVVSADIDAPPVDKKPRLAIDKNKVPPYHRDKKSAAKSLKLKKIPTK